MRWTPLRNPPISARDAALSSPERQVLVMVARGMTSVAIGKALHLSPKTVDSYRGRPMAKLKLGDVPAVPRWAIREGLISVDEQGRGVGTASRPHGKQGNPTLAFHAHAERDAIGR